jgi:hypothetical protein
MPGLRSQIGWLVRGGQRTHSALDEHARAIQELQREVARLAIALDPATSAAWEAVRDELRQAVDDLGARIGALSARLEQIQSS